MESHAVYNVTRGSVKPWKHTSFGLGIASLTGSKMVTQILNRTGHCISYSEIKGLETEFAYSAASNESDAPDGIRLDPNVTTALCGITIGSFSSDYEYDYEYEIRHFCAKPTPYACAISYSREKIVAVAHLSTKFCRKLVVLTTIFLNPLKVGLLLLFVKNNL